MKFRMNKRVKIISSKKTNDKYNFGTIVGIEKIQDGYYLGYINEKEFLSRFTKYRYKLAYVDCSTNKACEQWFYEEELE